MIAELVVDAGRRATGRLRDFLPQLPPSRTQAVELVDPARKRLWTVLPILALISLFYVILGSAGRFVDLTIAQTNYYDRLAQGFLSGHLYMIDTPNPVLLRQANPFAPGNLPFWIWDASFYRGHYYLYFGPVPALLLAGLRAVTGYQEVITDQWPTILFLLGRLYAGAALLLGVARRSKFPPPTWLCALSIAVLGLAHPVPYIAARPNVWETALAGGQCFLFVGLWFAFSAFWSGRWRRLWLVLAGTSWALAIGCRATMAIPTPLLMLATMAMLWHLGRRKTTWLVDAMCIGVPFALLCAAHGYYNWARFGSPFEFGIRYQTTLQPYRVSPSYVLPNLHAYFFTLLSSSCRFPFVILPAGRQLPELIGHPLGYATFEQLGGLTSLASWIWLIPLGAAVLAVQLRRVVPEPARGPLSAVEVWVLVAGLAITLSIVPVLHLWVAAPRYPGDAMGGLVLIGAVFAHYLVRRLAVSQRSSAKLTVFGLIPALGLATCVLGSLTAFAISTRTFEILNPTVYYRMESLLSLCPRDSSQMGLR